MLNPFIHLISNIISLINLGLIIWIVLGLLLHLEIVNRQNPLVMRIYATLGRIYDPILNPIRKQLNRLLPHLGIDLSPLVLILALNFVDNAMYTWFYAI